MSVDTDRLDALLGGPDVAWLRRRVRARLERGEPLDGVAALTAPSEAERAAVDRLLGRRPSTGASVTVPLAEVDRLLRRAGVADGLREAVEVLDGPIVDRGAQLAAERAAWTDVISSVDVAALGSWAGAWLDELADSGILRRLAADPEHAGRLLREAVRVLVAFPAGGIGRPRLAADRLDDSHALDDGRPVATLVLKALQHRRHGRGGALPSGEERRALWASAGVLVGELASTVLVHNLPSSGRGLTARVLSAHRAAGEPAWLTLRQLVRDPPAWSALRQRRVYVCENPAVVGAAASELTLGCAPLVCGGGKPSAAAQTLVGQLAAAGADLVYHGDFDWPGLAIGNLIVSRFGASPWRFTADDYATAPAGPPLTGSPVAARWAPELAGRMTARGVAVHEEQVVDDLLADLA